MSNGREYPLATEQLTPREINLRDRCLHDVRRLIVACRDTAGHLPGEGRAALDLLLNHKVSVKHLGRYVNEFSFRLNEGDVKRHSLERLDSFIDAIGGKRLTYARLTA